MAKTSTKALRKFAAKKGSTSKAKASKAEPKAKKPSGGPTVERDAFGCKAGSQAAVINAALTSKAQKVAALAESTGLDGGRIRAHLKHLLGKGLVVETDAGFATKKGK